jgi:hypothetical protein
MSFPRQSRFGATFGAAVVPKIYIFRNLRQIDFGKGRFGGGEDLPLPEMVLGEFEIASKFLGRGSK